MVMMHYVYMYTILDEGDIKEGSRMFEKAARKYATESFTCTFYFSMSKMDSILTTYTVFFDRMETVSK